VLLEHDGAAFALIRRPDPVDVITPYGYGGPAGRHVREFWLAYEEWCRTNGVLTTFVRFHPLYANAREAPIRVEPLAPTVAWRLGQADLAAGMHLNHRRAVRKAQKAGVTVTSDEGVGEFVPLYEETMRRAAASPFYFFSSAYWRGLERATVARFDAQLDGAVVASALCLASPPWLHYDLGASSDEARRIGAMHLLFLEAATWARERATSASTSAAASAGVKTRCTSSSAASTPAASWMPPSARPCTTRTRTRDSPAAARASTASSPRTARQAGSVAPCC